MIVGTHFSSCRTSFNGIRYISFTFGNRTLWLQAGQLHSWLAFVSSAISASLSVISLCGLELVSLTFGYGFFSYVSFTLVMLYFGYQHHQFSDCLRVRTPEHQLLLAPMLSASLHRNSIGQFKGTPTVKMKFWFLVHELSIGTCRERDLWKLRKPRQLSEVKSVTYCENQLGESFPMVQGFPMLPGWKRYRTISWYRAIKIWPKYPTV